MDLQLLISRGRNRAASSFVLIQIDCVQSTAPEMKVRQQIYQGATDSWKWNGMEKEMQE